jgi:hypothetical protein
MKDRLKSLTSSITSLFMRIPRRVDIAILKYRLKSLTSSITSLFMRIPRRVDIAILLAAIGVTAFLALWLIPEYRVSSYRTNFIDKHYWSLTPTERTQLDREMLKAENDARVTLAQILGGIALLSGLYLTWRNIRVTEDGKITDRYTKAIELLDSEKLDIRIGGIYALERIANGSQRDHWTIMEALTAFVRENSKKEKEKTLQLVLFAQDATQKNLSIPPDIQAALTVIGRRKWPDRETWPQVINLIGSFLPSAILSGANLSGAFLFEANLSGAFLREANLSRAHLNRANLSRADLIWANFSGADLREANLSRADLIWANFSGADLRGADLRGANLSGVFNLISNQIEDAITDNETKFPWAKPARRAARGAGG